MQYVNFGQTGLKISRLGFGGIPIQRIDQPGTRELLIAAHKAGVNYIDTARAYTVSEAWIGQSLEEAGLRDDFILATKCRAQVLQAGGKLGLHVGLCQRGVDRPVPRGGRPAG